MDLKDFIKDVVTSISDATAELQSDLAEYGVTVTQSRVIASAGAAPHPDNPDGSGGPRQVEKIDFDVAVLAPRDGGATGIRVVGPETLPAAADGTAAERASRVTFSLEISYPAMRDEMAGRTESHRPRPRRRAGSSGKWSRF